MGNDELRRKIIEGIDSTLEAPWIVRRFYTAEHIRLLNAMRRYWLSDRGDQLTLLSTMYDAEPARANDEPPP